jgi:hypothetical protein
MTQKTNQNPWTMDVRVRERNLKSGALTDKDLEKFLVALPDVADQAESFGISQPALAEQHVAAPVLETSAAADEHYEEDEEDDEDEDEDAVAVAVAEQPQQEEKAPEASPPDLGGDSGGTGEQS